MTETSELLLRSACFFDDSRLRFLYDLMAEILPNEAISHRELPTWQQHVAFVKHHPYRYFYTVEVDGQPVGFVTATQNNEIGIRLARQHCGRGLGRRVLVHFMRFHHPLPALPSVRQGCWVANINPTNASSIRMFEKLGFRHVQNTYTKEQP